VTDFRAPTTGVLRRLHDPRAAQYWDPAHLLAAQLPGEPECCRNDGILWDIAAVYPPGAQWTDKPPTPTLFNGPVVDALPPHFR
jgi:hypothetical protein